MCALWMRSSAEAALTPNAHEPGIPLSARGIAEDGVMLALACVLGLLEAWVALPVPGVRLGLANVAVLAVLVRRGPRAALRVSVGRALIVGLATGTLAGPVGVLALAGATASVLAMAGGSRIPGISLLGVSAIGSFAHVAAQFAAAAALASSIAVLALATPALLLSLPLGLVTGSAADRLISRLMAHETTG